MLLKQRIEDFITARLEYGNGTLTPKDLVLKDNVMYYVETYKTLGIFGEDGLEALHPKDTAKRELTRAMRSPKARCKAHMDHMDTMMRVKAAPHTKRKRRFLGQRV